MKVAVIDRFPNNFVESLQTLGLEVQDLREAPVEEVLSHLPEFEILVMNSKIPIRQPQLDLAKQLRLVLRAGVGMDHIDLSYAAQKGVKVFNTKGANADAVGEQTVGMLLAMRHHLIKANAQVKQFSWQRESNRGNELGDKVIGLIGYGHTGQSVARKLSGFNARVWAYDKYRNDYGDRYAQQETLETIMAKADVISFHVPLTDETKNWANASFFNQLGRPIYLLNLARGPIVDLSALLQALATGKVKAAALDVLPNEKLATLNASERSIYEKLFAQDNVMVSPHIGGWTFESRNNINQMILDRINAFLAES